MPYIQLHVADPDGAGALARELAGVVADALGLHGSDVLVSVAGSAGVHDATGPVAHWPSAVLCGRTRPASEMEAARSAAIEVLALRLGAPRDRVWVHWCAS